MKAAGVLANENAAGEALDTLFGLRTEAGKKLEAALRAALADGSLFPDRREGELPRRRFWKH